jgi:predicted nucleic acid-binding protein
MVYFWFQRTLQDTNTLITAGNNADEVSVAMGEAELQSVWFSGIVTNEFIYDAAQHQVMLPLVAPSAAVR